MFVLTLLADTIRIPPQLLAKPTLTSVQTEIEKRYPNKIIVDVGLVICPYGPPLEVGDGILVPGDGGAHHQVIFQCVVFRPFVEEVLVGIVTGSNEDGVMVSVGGFFDHVFIPAYWMLNPSVYDAESGLWVWTPKYDDDDDDENENESNENGQASSGGGDDGVVKQEEGEYEDPYLEGEVEAEEEEEENRFEIDIGSEIRFKVKAVNFTRITTTMKGVQATTTTTSHSSDRAFGLNGGSSNGSTHHGDGGGGNGAATVASSKMDDDDKVANGEENGDKANNDDNGAVRRRSSSADLSDSEKHPAPMQIVGSICEDGLGLTSWWKHQSGDDEEEAEGGEEEEEEFEEGE